MRLVPCLMLPALLAAGCAYPTSPVSTESKNSLSIGQVATLGAGTAAGAVLGDKIAGNTGALIGGAAGLAGVALVSNAVHSSASQESAEAAEAARREERLKIMQDYWYDKTLSAQADEAGGNHPPQVLQYPAGTYSGIRFAPRVAADPSLSEPAR